MTLIYLILSSFFLFLGYNSNRKKFIELFTFIVFVLPFINMTMAYHTNMQIPSYFFFFLGGVFKPNFKIKTYRIGSEKVIFLTFFLSLYFIITLPIYLDHNLIDIIKDLKVYIFSIIIFVYINKYKYTIKEIEISSLILKILKVNFIVSSIFLLAIITFNIQSYITTDRYFEINHLRYTNYFTFFLPFLLLLRLNLSKWQYLYIILPLLYSGNRTLIFLTLIMTLFYSVTNIKLNQNRSFIAFLVIVIPFLIIILPILPDNLGLFRILSLFNGDYIQNAIFTRVQPFLTAINGFQLEDFILGKGMGFTFYIPWFEYRPNIDNYNIYLDNLYLTLFTKYGLFFFLPLIWFVYLSKLLVHKRLISYFLFLFFLYGLTNSFLYQHYLYILFFILFLTKINEENDIRAFEIEHSNKKIY